jgi:hypothetical protein
VERARIEGAVRSCCTMVPDWSIPRITVRIDGVDGVDGVVFTFAGGALRLTLLPDVTGDSWS